VKKRGRVIGIDLGSRRIGVAVTDTGQTVATAVTTVVRGDDRAADHHALSAIVEEYDAVGVVVGLPISLSGEAGPAAQGVLVEVGELRAALSLEVETTDERLTTVAAAGALRAGGRSSREQRPVIDETAAAILLQAWVDRRRSRPDTGAQVGEK
jgi:putative Holliday junction resolvase